MINHKVRVYPSKIKLAKKKQLSIKEFSQSKHLMVATTGKAFGFVDYLLEAKGLKR